MSEVSDGVVGKKYACISFLAKAVITRAHGNTIPERGFRVNNSMLGKDSLALKEHTIVAKRVVKDIIHLYGSISNVPITRDLLMAARNVHSEYMKFVEDQKRMETLTTVLYLLCLCLVECNKLEEIIKI